MSRCMTRSVHIRPRQNDGSTYSSYINQMTTLSTTTHHTTTVLRPFFRDHPRELVPEENFWTSWCKGRLIEADTPTIRLGDTPSGISSAHLYHPPIFFTGWMPFLSPNQQCQSTEGNNWQLLATNHKLLLLLLLLHPFSGLFSRTTWVSRHQKGKPFWILQEQEMTRWSGISWTICKSLAPRSRQKTMPVPHHSVFTGRMPFLPTNQQCQRTEGKEKWTYPCNLLTGILLAVLTQLDGWQEGYSH